MHIRKSALRLSNFCAAAGLVIAAHGSASAATPQPFQKYILKAIDDLRTNYYGGGYDKHYAFTHPLPYDGKFIKPTYAGTIGAPPKLHWAPSMCVAGVTEIILTAINKYVAETHDATPFKRAGYDLWTSGKVLSLRANLFMYDGTGSLGTGDTLKRFGMGDEVTFDALQPGDFINLNRTNKTGHAVAFMGYLNGQGALVPYGPTVKGFKYFSLQGKGKPDAGFADRYAYFDGFCPAATPHHVNDCHVIKSSHQEYMNMGRLYMPQYWTTPQKISDMTRLRSQEATGRGEDANAVLNKELPAVIPSKYDDN